MRGGPLAPPAGVTALPALNALPAVATGFPTVGRNIDFGAVGVEDGSAASADGSTPSDSYLFVRPFPQVWRAYRALQTIYEPR